MFPLAHCPNRGWELTIIAAILSLQIAHETILSSPASPFGRKVNLVIALKNLKAQVEIVPVDATKGDATATLNAANPLGRIPALIISGGEALHDSHVICEYHRRPCVAERNEP